MHNSKHLKKNHFLAIDIASAFRSLSPGPLSGGIFGGFRRHVFNAFKEVKENESTSSHLKARATNAMRVILEVRRSFPKTRSDFVANAHAKKLQFALERIQKFHSINLITETGEQCPPDSPDDERTVPLNDTADDTTTTTITTTTTEKTHLDNPDHIFYLPKSKQPEVPSNAIISWYSSTTADLRNFARDWKLPLRKTKFEAYKFLLATFDLPQDRLYILDSDVNRSFHDLHTLDFKATPKCNEEGEDSDQSFSDSQQNHATPMPLLATESSGNKLTLKVQFPVKKIPSGQLPISHFIYISTIEDVIAVTEFLTNKSLDWKLSQLNGTDCEMLQSLHFHFPESSIIAGCPELTSVGVDTETTGLNPHSCNLRILALAIPKYPTLLFDVKKLWGWDGNSIISSTWEPPYSAVALTSIGDNRDHKNEFETIPHHEIDTRSRLWKIIKDILESPKVTKIFFNGKFDYKFLLRHLDICIQNPIRDCMLDSYLLEAGLEPQHRHYNLNSAVEHYLHFQLQLPKCPPQGAPGGWKKDELISDQLLYASRDAAILPYLSSALTPSINRHGLATVSELEAQCMRAVAEIELNGMLLDISKWRIIEENVHEDTEKHGFALREALGWNTEENKSKNINSPLQVTLSHHIANNELMNYQICEALRQLNIKVIVERQKPFEDLPKDISTFTSLQNSEDDIDMKCETKKFRTPTQIETFMIEKTDNKTLKTIQNCHPAVDLLLKYRSARKMQSAYVERMTSFINARTGRVHAQMNQTGTNSGRFSCDSPNLQQIPRGSAVRACFVASPGHKLIISDMSQIELRIAADLAPDFLMIEAFSKGQDLHRLTASLVKGVPMSEVTKADRQMAKAVNFGLIYGISAKGLQQYAQCSYGVALTLNEAEEFRKKFFDNYKGIAAWHHAVKRTSRSEGHQVFEEGVWFEETRTRSNRRALFSEMKRQFQKYLNYPVQGTSADMMKHSLAQLIDLLPKVKGKLLHCVHDEIIVEVPDDFAEEALHLVVSTMKKSGDKYFRHLKCEAEGAIGTSWSEKP